MSKDEREPVAPFQAVFYQFLSTAFLYPVGDRRQELETRLPLLRQLARSAEEIPSPNLDEVEDALNRLPPLEEWQAGYTSLFVNNYPVLPCPLLESIHREGTLVGESTEQVAQAFLAFGLEAKTLNPDHLASELEFAGYLSGTKVTPTEAPRYAEARRNFLKDHLYFLGNRVYENLTRAQKTHPGPCTDFYLALSRLLKWLFEVEEIDSF